MNGLLDLLADGTRYSPCYRPSMNSDHMPMTLCAIAGLGGDLDACVAYRDKYKNILHEIPRENPIRHWRNGIGRSELYPSLFAWFRQRVAERGIEYAVREYLPEFIVGLPLEAFHPVIRLAYAVDFDSEAETAAALAYLVSRFQAIPMDADQVVDVEKQLRIQIANGSRSFEAAGFTRRIRELVEAGEYPVGRAPDLGECASIALDIYRSTRNFFALHMVTATQAARICSEFVDRRLVLAALTGGLLAAHRVVGSPDIDRDTPMAVPDELGGEHRFKYVWACLSEYRHYRDERYAEEIRGFRDKGLVPAWCAAGEI